MYEFQNNISDVICTTGRSQADYDREGTGDRLVLQFGSDLMTIPATEREANTTMWSYGKCFGGMGKEQCFILINYIIHGQL